MHIRRILKTLLLLKMGKKLVKFTIFTQLSIKINIISDIICLYQTNHIFREKKRKKYNLLIKINLI